MSMADTESRSWSLYILRCGDGSLYTGIAVNVAKRLAAHRSGKGAKYTRGRGPLQLVYTQECGSHSDALRRELEVKALPREEKEKLISASQGNHPATAEPEMKIGVV